MSVSMEALDMDDGRRYGLGASVGITPKGDGSGAATATVSASTPALVVLGIIGAGVMLMMLSQGVEPGRLQGAVPALAGRVGERLSAAA
jgi:hypothetical protein